jgi:hypothetical protein
MAGNSVSVRVGAPGAKQASSEIDQLRDKFTKLQKQGTKGLAIGAGAAVATKAMNVLGNAVGDVGQFIGESIQAASDLNETMNKSQVVFGDSSKQMEAFGKTSAKPLGLSENAAVGAAASIGNLLLSTGTAPSKIEPMPVRGHRQTGLGSRVVQQHLPRGGAGEAPVRARRSGTTAARARSGDQRRIGRYRGAGARLQEGERRVH